MHFHMQSIGDGFVCFASCRLIECTLFVSVVIIAGLLASANTVEQLRCRDSAIFLACQRRLEDEATCMQTLGFVCKVSGVLHARDNVWSKRWDGTGIVGLCSRVCIAQICLHIKLAGAYTASTAHATAALLDFLLCLGELS